MELWQVPDWPRRQDSQAFRTSHHTGFAGRDRCHRSRLGREVSLASRGSRTLLALGLFLAGCAGSPLSHEPTSGVAGTPTPDPPAFLTGAAALLLAQPEGVRAHLLLTT